MQEKNTIPTPDEFKEQLSSKKPKSTPNIPNFQLRDDEDNKFIDEPEVDNDAVDVFNAQQAINKTSNYVLDNPDVSQYYILAYYAYCLRRTSQGPVTLSKLKALVEKLPEKNINDFKSTTILRSESFYDNYNAFLFPSVMMTCNYFALEHQDKYLNDLANIIEVYYKKIDEISNFDDSVAPIAYLPSLPEPRLKIKQNPYNIPNKGYYNIDDKRNSISNWFVTNFNKFFDLTNKVLIIFFANLNNVKLVVRPVFEFMRKSSILFNSYIMNFGVISPFRCQLNELPTEGVGAKPNDNIEKDDVEKDPDPKHYRRVIHSGYRGGLFLTSTVKGINEFNELSRVFVGHSLGFETMKGYEGGEKLYEKMQTHKGLEKSRKFKIEYVNIALATALICFREQAKFSKNEVERVLKEQDKMGR